MGDPGSPARPNTKRLAHTLVDVNGNLWEKREAGKIRGRPTFRAALRADGMLATEDLLPEHYSSSVFRGPTRPPSTHCPPDPIQALAALPNMPSAMQSPIFCLLRLRCPLPTRASSCCALRREDMGNNSCLGRGRRHDTRTKMPIQSEIRPVDLLTNKERPSGRGRDLASVAVDSLAGDRLIQSARVRQLRPCWPYHRVATCWPCTSGALAYVIASTYSCLPP